MTSDSDKSIGPMEFNTKTYCKQERIPCFTFTMNASKKCTAKWKHITRDNFVIELRDHENGFAIITGHTHTVIDLDLKHNPPSGDANCRRQLASPHPCTDGYPLI